MKAAVLHRLGGVPRYEDFPDPVAVDGDVSVRLEAVTLDYAVKVLAAGTHFASRRFYPQLPAIVGHGGVGSREDGSLVSFQGIRPPYGSFAERVSVPGAYAIPIPPGVDAAQAAVIPSAASSSLLPLRHVAKLQAGETVLVNGATVTARTPVIENIAIQFEKFPRSGVFTRIVVLMIQFPNTEKKSPVRELTDSEQPYRA